MANIKKYFNKLGMKIPVMIACWAGMGNVGIGTVDYIRLKLGASLLAEIDSSDLIAPDAVYVHEGISSLPRIPKISVYFSKTPPLLISAGKEQLYGKAGTKVMEKLLDVAQEFKVGKIFTCAAFPVYMSHRSESIVYAAANGKGLLRQLTEKHRLLTMPEGQISGLNGLFLEASRKRKIEAACLLATLPIYSISLPNPRASKAVIKKLENIIGMDINTADLDVSINEVDKMLQNIEEHLKHLGLEEDRERPAFRTEPEELPKKIFDKIEKMFEEARKDKKIAHRLKEELDRWDLFKMYEDRFLDLFGENH